MPDININIDDSEVYLEEKPDVTLSVSIEESGKIEATLGEEVEVNLDTQILYIKSGQKEIKDYVDNVSKPDIDEYVETTTETTATNIINTITKPQIDAYAEEVVKPYSDSAKTSEDNAKTSETNAKTSEDNAKTSETNASTSETNALAYKNSASDYASQSQASAQASEEAKDLAVNAKNEATSQATIATNASNNAVSQANIATTKAGEAQTYASNAHNSETNAKTSEDNAKASEENAEDYKDRCEYIFERMGTVIKIKGRVNSLDDLPTSGNLDGDAYLVGEEGLDSYPEYYWYQNHWEFLGTSQTKLEWGAITGTLSSQTDLQNALDGKYDASNPNGFITSAYHDSTKQDNLTAGNGIAISNNKVSNTKMFTITEDMVTVTTDSTKGVAPYSTSYGYTNVEISADSGIEWVEGALYNFIIDTKLVVSITYRNVRIRIGSSGDWKPLMGSSSTIASGSTYFVKSYTTIYQYKSVYQSGGALHVMTDNNTTYSYLVNTIPVGSLKIDNNGYGARYSLVFPTTPLSTIDERFSSLVKSSNSGTTKIAQTDLTFYADRHPQYISSANISAGGVSASVTYQDYMGMDLRYSVNTNSTWVSVNKKVFLWLKNFNEEDMSFKADATIGNIFSIDKLATKFPNTMTGDVYIYFLGWNSSTWYTLSPNFTQEDKIFKYTPSTGVLVELNAEEHAKKQDKLPDGDTGYVLTKTDDGVEWSKGGVTATYDETTETITFA